MNKPPLLLRRTNSAVPPSDSATPTSSSTHGIPRGRTGSFSIPPAPEPGSGGQINPDDAIPIADADPGTTIEDNLSVSTHKRKTSGIPLEAEAIYNRASVQTSLEQITDEEEGGGLSPIGINRSFSESDLEGGKQRALSVSMQDDSTHGSSMPEFNDLFPENNTNSRVRSVLRLLLTTKGGLASVALLMLSIAYVSMRSPHPSKVGVSPIHNTPTGANIDLAGSAEINNNANPNSKDITMGEFHEEIVGTPMEHHIHEYNKIRFYDSPSKMLPIVSKGPIQYNEKIGGLYLFENVCLTNNIDALRYKPNPETTLRGLIYFKDPENDQDGIMKNEKRCVPCSNHDAMQDDWYDTTTVHSDEKVVKHKCGMEGLHTMFASSVNDWTTCIQQPANMELMQKLQQTQSPTNVSTIHFFQEPTFLLQFNQFDMEQSLFEMLLTYLPHWDNWLNGNDVDDAFVEDESEENSSGNTKGFPFDSVISHSLQGCLSHSHNWFCEILHQMYAFGEAKEIPWESDDNTLYCYRELFYNQVGYQRNLNHEGLITKENFGEMREMLFRKFALPRRRTVEDRLAEKEYEKIHGGGGNTNKNDDGHEDDTKIIFYDNKLSDQTVWNQMEVLISKARELEKYSHIKFVTVKDQVFVDLPVAQQARLFNQADAVIMAHGQHMGNAIFAVDGTSFVEVGCKVQSLIGQPKFMDLMDGKYRAVERCGSAIKTSGSTGGDGDDEVDEGEGGGRYLSDDVCVVCKGGEDDSNFTMTPAAFEKLIDDVVASL